jgi:glutaredoxin
MDAPQSAYSGRGAPRRFEIRIKYEFAQSMTTFPIQSARIMAFTFFWRWLGGSPRQRPDLQVLVYTRPACPLCEEAWELLERWQKVYGFSLRSQNIEQSAELIHEHGEWVPVVRVNGKVHFRGHVNEILLRRILDA